MSEDYSGFLEDLQAEFMEGMEAGDRDKWDFALENSDEANDSLQALGMEMMRIAGPMHHKHKESARAPALALWALCARQAFLDVVETKVAPIWAEKEMPKRVAEFEEAVEFWP